MRWPFFSLFHGTLGSDRAANKASQAMLEKLRNSRALLKIGTTFTETACSIRIAPRSDAKPYFLLQVLVPLFYF
jgi:hypothetical protein